MEESLFSNALSGKITGITFSLSTRKEIGKSSNSDCAITHASQLSNPFLGLPLEVGKCESCGTSEPGQCEGHFGYIELPIPIYHPDHVGELKRMLNLLCLKCLKIKNRKFPVKNIGVVEQILSSCCEDASEVAVNEKKTADGVCYLELKVPSRKNLPDSFWNFLEKYGFRYGDKQKSRPLLPYEAMAILRKIPVDTRKKLLAKGYFPQEGYILQYLPVPPNCVSVPDISDGTNIMSRDHSISLLKRVLRQIEVIKNSRSGMPNFESGQIESNDLQAAIAQYFQFRGTGKASRYVDTRFGVNKVSNTSSTKAWLEKMKTLFIRKSSGFSSRSVITGDPYKGVNEIGLPFEIAQKMTFEEKVSQHNMNYLQKLVDEKLCLTYRDGMSTYSLREGSKGHTFLRLGQIVHRRIMDGDMVFINRPPTTHKHSLQALSVYIHDDHTVKINPLICGPLSADFDGDCIHLFYPQSLAARAEVLELFSVEKQLLSSHTGNFNLQLATDSLLSLKLMFKSYFFDKVTSQQLVIFVPTLLPEPAVIKYHTSGPHWTVLQLLQIVLPLSFECSGERYLTHKNELVKFDFNKDSLQSTFSDIVTSILLSKGPKEVVSFFNSLTPLLMDYLDSEGFSVCLEDFYIPKALIDDVQESIRNISSLLSHMRLSSYDSLQIQLNNYLRGVKLPIANMVVKSAIGYLIDSKSESALSKVVQQMGFLGIQLADSGKLYSGTLVHDMALLFHGKYPSCRNYPSEEFGLVRSCLFHGLDPYQEMVHSISSREVIIRSTRGLTEPGTLFKNLMAILRDVVICYDGTVRNMCSNSIIQFQYGANHGNKFNSEFGAGEPVGVLAATAMSNPAYKAVLDSSPSSNSSWEMMKEILLCGVNFKNEVSDRRVILYLKDCGCGRKYCRENASYTVKNQLQKVSLKDVAMELLIEYRQQLFESSEIDTGLVGHIHLNEALLKSSNISMDDILSKCDETISPLQKKKKSAHVFSRVIVGASDYCSFQHSSECNFMRVPCLTFSCQDAKGDHVEQRSHILAEIICPALLETVIKGDPRVSTANIIWINPDTPTWIRSPCKSQIGELALDVVLEKHSVKQSGDAWRVVMDSCIPVIHLIDTHRSIPYAIKQVQELLGISCAFEQAVQRLSTSVMMVTKGVLKDHLVLLANSMTSAGNLIGFNIGGIKALSRSLNVQVPFTEATLSAPRKCFERAAEKCHVDSLSSVVASCSWGKEVAVGTGSAFDLFLDTRKVELNQADGVDVYDFLQLVSGGSSGEETSTACLGAEIENLDLNVEDMGYELSPLRDSEQPTFEDGHEFDDQLANEKEIIPGEIGWEQVKRPNGETTVASDSAWSRWGNGAAGKGGNSEKEKDLSSTLSQWNARETGGSWKKPGSSSVWDRDNESESDLPLAGKHSGNWETTTDEHQNVGGSRAASDSAWSGWGDGAVGKGVGSETEKEHSPTGISWKLPGSSSVWGRNDESESDLPLAGKHSGNWERTSDKDQNIGGSRTVSDSAWSGWGNGAVGKGVGSETEKEHSPSSSEWNAREPGSNWKQPGSSSVWGTKTESDSDLPLAGKHSSNWKATTSEDQNMGGSKAASDSAWSGWGSGPVAADAVKQDSSKNGEWGSKVSITKKLGSSSAWDKKFNSESNPPLISKPIGSCDQKIDKWQNCLASRAPSGSGWSSWDVGQVVQEDDLSNRMRHNSPNQDNRDTEEPKSFERLSGQAWGKKSDSGKSSPGWDQKFDKGQNFEAHTSASDSGWSSWGTVEVVKEDSFSNRVLQNSPNQEKWDLKESKITGEQSRSSAWGQKIDSDKNAPHGGSDHEIDRGWNVDAHKDVDAVHVENTLSTTIGEGSAKSGVEIAGFQSNEENYQSAGGKGWRTNRQSQWCQQKGSKGDATKNTRGWDSAASGEWKNRRNHHPTEAVENQKASGTFTLSRQRLDLFTVEEQDVLLDVEQMMQNIRRIIHQTGYNDGDPLSADDQSYVVDYVLNYHPDKALKIGSGIQYIMVSKHANFQDTRCFYVVSTDNHKQDFSYRKSLENFIKGKYPDKAEAFLAKYFKRPQPRPGWSRERTPAASKAGTQPEQ